MSDVLQGHRMGMIANAFNIFYLCKQYFYLNKSHSYCQIHYYAIIKKFYNITYLYLYPISTETGT